MQDFKKSENIISNGSFSKICSPGIRLGWIEAAPKIIASIAQSGILRSGGAVNNVMSGIIACSLQDGSLAHHINDLRNEYGNRMRTVCDYLKDNLPDGFNFQTPGGGYFIWIVGMVDYFRAEKMRKNMYTAEIFPAGKSLRINERNFLNLKILTFF